MPMFNTLCTACYEESERYLAHEFHRELMPMCDCGGFLSFLPSFGRGLTYFEEGRGRWIHNMSDRPVYVDSWWKHKQLMREHGVAEAPQRRGMPGCWF